MDNVLKPADCLIGVAIPLMQHDFFAQQQDTDHEFARCCCSSWAKYESEIADPFFVFQERIRKLGVKLTCNMTSEMITGLFTTSNKHITLIAHWSAGKIELFDKMVTFQDFVLKIPKDYVGIIDLCVCTPEELVNEIKSKRPNCSVRYIQETVSIANWFYFYWVLFQYLQVSEGNYQDAFTKVTKTFLKKIR